MKTLTVNIEDTLAEKAITAVLDALKLDYEIDDSSIDKETDDILANPYLSEKLNQGKKDMFDGKGTYFCRLIYEIKDLNKGNTRCIILFYNMSIALSEQEIIRRESLQKLRELGINPYPAEAFDVNAWAQDINDNFEKSPDKYKQVVIAGRIMTRRIMGSASFAEIQDSTGRVQIYIKRDDICPGEDKTLYNTVFKKLLDIGDYVGIKGYVFLTQTGEISVHTKS
jgi:hypothetical protein